MPGRVHNALLERAVAAAVIPEETLHHIPRPYTLSPLMPAQDTRRNRQEKAPEPLAGIRGTPKGHRFRLRMSWLEDTHLPAFIEWAPTLGSSPLLTDGDDGSVRLEGVVASPTLTEKWSRSITYEHLYAEAADSLRTITLKFNSPTLLNRAGLPYPLPDPAGIFLGYLHLWDYFSGIPLDPGLNSAVKKKLHLVDFRIRNQPFKDEKGAVACFVGSATFQLQGRQPETMIKGFNALADYAFFCGTGTGTDKGRGMTRRIWERA